MTDDDERGPDLRGPAVIVEGSVIGGFKFIGPFETIEAASQWHDKFSLPGLLGLQVSIVLLESPTDHAVMQGHI